MRQGYITLATGDNRYFEMALNVALSVKAKDPNRPVALIHDGKRDITAFAQHFDDIVVMPHDPNYNGTANKLRLYDVSPYEASMFLDADCLIVKSDMNRHWERFVGHPMNMAGDIKHTGTWYGFDIEEVCKILDLPYLCVMNSGVFYFERGDEAAKIITTANAYYNQQIPILSVTHQGRTKQIADEPFFSAAMAHHGVIPLRYTPEEGSIMVTSWGARAYDADPARDYVRVVKPKSASRFDRFLPFSSIHHSPSIMHFIGLKPKKMYNRLTNEFRRSFGVDEIVL